MNKETTIALEADPDDPEDFDVTVAALERALAERRARVGRPTGSTTSKRQSVSLRLPRVVIDHFKADGPGWQTRVIAVLEREVANAPNGSL